MAFRLDSKLGYQDMMGGTVTKMKELRSAVGRFQDKKKKVVWKRERHVDGGGDGS